MNNRFMNENLSELEKSNRNPIFDYEELPILSLKEAIERITPLVPRCMDYVTTALEKYNQNSILLTRDESAAIYLYTMQTTLFLSLNEALRSENRETLKPWLAFLKLFMTALEKIPSIRTTVWRGINCDDTLTYVDDDVHIWWSVNSCSLDASVIKPFLNDNGTVFVIEAIHAKDISVLSAVSDEKEVILMPGTRVRRKYGTLDLGTINVLQLEEIDPQW